MGRDPVDRACLGPQENPYLWNTFADGRLSFFNEELLRIVLGKQDKAVQEFWRLLAICHTVMVQEKDSECSGPWALPGLDPQKACHQWNVEAGASGLLECDLEGESHRGDPRP